MPCTRVLGDMTHSLCVCLLARPHPAAVRFLTTSVCLNCHHVRRGVAAAHAHVSRQQVLYLPALYSSVSVERTHSTHYFFPDKQRNMLPFGYEGHIHIDKEHSQPCVQIVGRARAILWTSVLTAVWCARRSHKNTHSGALDVPHAYTNTQQPSPSCAAATLRLRTWICR